MTQQDCNYFILEVFFQSGGFANQLKAYILNLAASLLYYYKNTFAHRCFLLKFFSMSLSIA